MGINSVSHELQLFGKELSLGQVDGQNSSIKSLEHFVQVGPPHFLN